MNVTSWKKQDPIKEILGFDHPFWGLSALPTQAFFSDPQELFYPAIDVSEDSSNIVVKADLPGLKKEDIQVDVHNDVLIIRGERKYENEEKTKDYHRVERSYGVFQRSLRLGTPVDQNKITAQYRDGVLEVTIPKTEVEKGKRVSIE